jgi:4-diphosphocytidyl-2-C-methyl-D-erythritol kinase
MSITVFAPAKINLTLGVGGAQLDGRHPLDSLVAFTRTIGDKLTLEPDHELSLTIDGPFSDGLSSDNDNLVLRAAHLLADQFGAKQGVHIRLTKSLPIASGIGGGSADAAAALIGLNSLWGGGLSLKHLQDLAAKLGADVPACVSGQPLRMTGTGETTQNIGSLPSLGIVLVNPLVPCPTGPVYRRFDEMGHARPLLQQLLPALTKPADLLAYLHQTPNDLEPAAQSLVPEIGTTLAAIASSPGVLLTRMSGSGATCFGLYESLAKAQIGAVAIKKTLAIKSVWVEADEIKSAE